MPIHDPLWRRFIFSASYAIVPRSDSALAFRVTVVQCGGPSQRYETGVEEHDVEQSKVGYCHGEHEDEVDDQKRRGGSGASASPIEKIIDWARPQSAKTK